jgi:secondary thiamine-phosphate synthase enzyme
MQTITVRTKSKKQVVNISDLVAQQLPKGDGVVTVFTPHTGAAITTANLDPGTDLDLLDFLDGIVPDRAWRHPHNSKHAPDHLLASIIGPSVSLPYQNGQLALGIWQYVVLIELDGPRERTVMITAQKA